MDTPSPLGLDPQPQSQSTAALPRAHVIIGTVAIALGLFLMLLRAFAWSHWELTPETIGYAIGSALFPALTAYLIAIGRPRTNFRRFGITFGGISLLLFLLTDLHPIDIKQHIGDLMKEAAGMKAISSNSEIDGLIRDFMHGVLEDRKNFEKETAPFDAEIRKLYSVETFSSRAAMQKSIDAVRGIVAVDQRYSKRIEGIPDRVQESVDRSTLSDSDKRDFMEGIRKSFGDLKALQIRRQAMGTETQWEDATLSLYGFAMANAAQIRPEGKRLIIGGERIRSEFNARMDKAQKIRHEIIDLNAQLESAQQAALQEVGLMKKDIGLDENSQPNKK